MNWTWTWLLWALAMSVMAVLISFELLLKDWIIRIRKRRRRHPPAPDPGGPELTEAKLDLALAVDERNEILRAVLQLIKTAEENANSNAADDIHVATVMAGYVGGAQHLRMLRDDLLQRRQRGIEALGAVRPA